MKIVRKLNGSITLIETASLALFGLIFLMGFFAFQERAGDMVRNDGCVGKGASLTNQELVEADLLDDEDFDPCLTHSGELDDMDDPEFPPPPMGLE